ncbi:hypothetical protein STEG23_002929, partial [Scotinomys teguina]
YSNSKNTDQMTLKLGVVTKGPEHGTEKLERSCMRTCQRSRESRKGFLVCALMILFLMVEAIVEFDYQAQHDDELTISVGEVITNIRKEDGGWWEGQINGRRDQKAVVDDDQVAVFFCKPNYLVVCSEDLMAQYWQSVNTMAAI